MFEISSEQVKFESLLILLVIPRKEITPLPFRSLSVRTFRNTHTLSMLSSKRILQEMESTLTYT